MLKHSESEIFFFSLKRFSDFERIQIIVVVPGKRRNSFKSDDNLTKNALLFSKLCRQFSKKNFWRVQKETWKLNYIVGLKMYKILYFAY